ncbi:MAG: hypothetical protein WB566_12975 [Terriglobales bacterium]
MKASFSVLASASVVGLSLLSISAVVAYPLHSTLLTFAQVTPPTPDPVAKFTTAEVIFYTTGEDKDGDTEVELFVYGTAGDPPKAYLDIGGGKNPHVPNAGFPKNSTSGVYHLPPVNNGFSYGDLAKMHFKVHPAPRGKDVWNFRIEVMMHFSDGTRAWMKRAEASVGTVHTRGIDDAIWPLGDLTINPPCVPPTGLCR